MKTHIVYEILWEQYEYGGLSKSAGATVHSSLELALKYKESHEANRSRDWPNDDPFSNHGSSPQPKVVSAAVYKRLLAKETGSN